jgi:3,4-dihydroxyphthalate decarboxylase
MVEAMGDRPVVLLRGHGLTSTGADVPEAVLRAVSVDQLARLP